MLHPRSRELCPSPSSPHLRYQSQVAAESRNANRENGESRCENENLSSAKENSKRESEKLGRESHVTETTPTQEKLKLSHVSVCFCVSAVEWGNKMEWQRPLAGHASRICNTNHSQLTATDSTDGLEFVVLETL